MKLSRYIFSLFILIIFLFTIAVISKFNYENGFSNNIKITDYSSENAKKFYNGALKQVGVVKKYDFSNGYYGNGGYPPDDIGVCSDVIWRSFLAMDLDFKKLINSDIKKNQHLYNLSFDSNIDFRRVKKINTFLSRNSKKITNNLLPNDLNNLEKWQTGDIVIFDELKPKNLWHIAIITDKRRKDGVPYMIDNHGYGVSVLITPLDWPTKIIGHYRYF